MDETSRILLRHQTRGLQALYPILPHSACNDAAKDLLRLPKGNILIVTGFCCFGAGETDGPVGSHFLALALKMLGFSPIIVTDNYSSAYFDHADHECICCGFGTDFHALAEELRPVACIAIERCGRASDGGYYSMGKKDISDVTPPLDTLFLERAADCLTIGIGDGGNEIGMGNYHETLQATGKIIPSCVTADHSIVATVSNWGAYGLMAALAMLTGNALLPDAEQVDEYLHEIVRMGATDGILGPDHCSTDGFPPSTDAEIIAALAALR
ncbi:MAG: DUF4392 domain-containing protein [Bacteroidales bacterium]|nr:DUF4392 domain-containing protein [Bacteroidales bacterium]